MAHPVRTRRKQLGITLKRLAKTTGLSESCISNIEHNKCTPKEETAKLIANALDVPVKKLFNSLSDSGRPPLTGKPLAPMRVTVTADLCPYCFLQLPVVAKTTGRCPNCGEMYEIPLERS